MAKNVVEKKYDFLIVGLLIGILLYSYSGTLNNSIGYTDSGELAAVAYTLGIPHPTGYPLFTLFAHFVLIPGLPIRTIFLLNIMAMLLVVAALVLLYKFIQYVLTHCEKGNTHNPISIYIIPAVVSLALGFSSTVWLQSTNVEVYALHFFLIILFLYVAIKALLSDNGEKAKRYQILAAYCLGLSFTNHMTTVLLLPGWLLLLWYDRKKFARGMQLYVVILMFFAIALTMYCFLPFRALQHPPLNWGNPSSLDRLLWHVSGKQYQVWMFEGLTIAQQQLKRYISNFTNEYVLVFLLFLIIGLVVLYNRQRQIFWLCIVMYCCNILYVINYHIFDIEPYYLLSQIVLGVIIAVGILKCVEYFIFKLKTEKFVIILFLLLLPVAQYYYHIDMVNKSKTTVAEDFTKHTLASLPNNAVVISGLWDYFVSPALYLQFVEKYRDDVLILDYHLLKNRVWYYTQLQTNAPWLADRIKDEIHLFLTELEKFERGQPYDIHTIQSAWTMLLKSLINACLKDRSVFIDVRLVNEISQFFVVSPWCNLVQLSLDDVRKDLQLQPAFKFTSIPGSIVEQDIALYLKTQNKWVNDWLAKRGISGFLQEK